VPDAGLGSLRQASFTPVGGDLVVQVLRRLSLQIGWLAHFAGFLDLFLTPHGAETRLIL
jgi:hypothetical protein